MYLQGIPHACCNSDTITRLSAYLYEETQNAAYYDEAQLSLNFMVNHMWNGTIVNEGFDLDTCTPGSGPQYPVLQAGFIEGEALRFCA